MKTENLNCPICGKNQHTKLIRKSNIDISRINNMSYSSRKKPELMHNDLYICTECDLIFSRNNLSNDELDNLYKNADFESSSEAKFASRSYGQILDKFIDNIPDRLSALDIGTGEGSFLQELLDRKFENVIGVEPSQAPIIKADSNVSNLIMNMSFKKSFFAEDSFSLVTCFQTLEHIPNPINITNEIFKILKPGGHVFIVVHNKNSFVNRFLKFKSPIIDIEHLQIFSRHSAKLLLKKFGFTNVRIVRVINKYPLKYWVLLPLKKKDMFIKILTTLKISNILIPLNVGNLAVIGNKNV